MFIPASYAESRIAVMQTLMQQHPLGTLVTLDPDGLNANHLPFELDATVGEFGVLRAHAARANPRRSAIPAATPPPARSPEPQLQRQAPSNPFRDP